MKLMSSVLAGTLIVPSAFAGIVIDGTLDASYTAALSTQTENPTSGFGGGNWLDAIYASDEATNLYIFLEGTVSDNALVLFLDVPAVDGDVPNPTPTPTGGGGAVNGGQFANTVLELPDLDFAFSGNQPTSNPTSYFLDGVDYVDDAAPNDADFLGADAVIVSSPEASSHLGNFITVFGSASVEFSYNDADVNLPGAGGSSRGFEIKIPKAVIGAGSAFSVNIFAALTNKTGFFSRHVLPPATGHGNFTIGGPNANFLADTVGTGGTANNDGNWGVQVLIYNMAVTPPITATTDWALYQ